MKKILIGLLILSILSGIAYFVFDYYRTQHNSIQAISDSIFKGDTKNLKSNSDGTYSLTLVAQKDAICFGDIEYLEEHMDKNFNITLVSQKGDRLIMDSKDVSARGHNYINLFTYGFKEYCSSDGKYDLRLEKKVENPTLVDKNALPQFLLNENPNWSSLEKL